MSFMRFIGGRPSAGQAIPEPMPLQAETEAVRTIVARLESLPPEKAKFLAGMAYVLARTANADMVIADVEMRAIEAVLVEAGLDESQAVLVAEMAKLQERTSGGTSDFLVTREFRESWSPDDCIALLQACYRITAADGAISSEESAALTEIADELGLDRVQAAAVRAQFADRISARLSFRPNA